MLRPPFLSRSCRLPRPAAAATYSAKPPPPPTGVRRPRHRLGLRRRRLPGRTDESRPLVLCQSLAKRAGRSKASPSTAMRSPPPSSTKCNAVGQGRRHAGARRPIIALLGRARTPLCAAAISFALAQ